MSSNGLKSAFDTTKQLLTLSTGALTVTITFAEKFAPSTAALTVPLSLRLAWCAYFGVIVFGALTMMAITGTFEAKDQGNEGGANDRNVRLPALAMVLLFLAATALTVRAGFLITR